MSDKLSTIQQSLQELQTISSDIIRDVQNKNQMLHKGLRTQIDNYRQTQANMKRFQ